MLKHAKSLGIGESEAPRKALMRYQKAKTYMLVN